MAKQVKQTTAKQIAAQFGNDGSRFEDARGETLDVACDAEEGYRTEAAGSGTYRWDFADGSCITVAGPAWDLGYSSCFCWQGGGHSEDCLAARKAVQS
jgi:hypothetical protein